MARKKAFDPDNNCLSYNNYFNLPPELSSYAASRFVVLPAPFEASTTYRQGTRNGPRAMLEASWYIELNDMETGGEAWRAGIHTDKTLSREFAGFAAFREAARKRVATILRDGKTPVLLGGEHSITLPAVEAALEHFGTLNVLHLDAHTDLRNHYDGNLFNHACVMRRVAELPGVRRIVQVGVRSACQEEIRFVAENKRLHTVPGRDIRRGKTAPADTLKGISGPVYLTIDLDAFDPAEAPGVGTPEPGGLRWNFVSELLELLIRNHHVVGLDIVELCPIRGQTVSEYLAVKLLFRILGWMADRGGGQGKKQLKPRTDTDKHG